MSPLPDNALFQAAVLALQEATDDALLLGTGYVRITAIQVQDGITFDIERADPLTIRVHPPAPRTAPEIEDERPPRRHRDLVDCRLARGLISPDTLAQDTGAPCGCEEPDPRVSFRADMQGGRTVRAYISRNEAPRYEPRVLEGGASCFVPIRIMGEHIDTFERDLAILPRVGELITYHPDGDPSENSWTGVVIGIQHVLTLSKVDCEGFRYPIQTAHITLVRS
jgi:hypothetical protein